MTARVRTSSVRYWATAPSRPSHSDDLSVLARAMLRLAAMPDPPAILDAGRGARTLRRLHTLMPWSVLKRALRKQFGLSSVG